MPVRFICFSGNKTLELQITRENIPSQRVLKTLERYLVLGGQEVLDFPLYIGLGFESFGVTINGRMTSIRY
jgi:hypothetical protein